MTPSPRHSLLRWLALPAVSLLLGSFVAGTGHAQSIYPAPRLHPNQGEPRGLAVGDLNDDGDLDLVVASHRSGRVLIHPGLGDGGFSVARSLFVGGEPVSVATTDFDRDGLMDVVYVDELEGVVGVLLQRPTFPVSYEMQTMLGADEPRFVLATDLDGDAWPDVVVAQRGADQVSVFWNSNGQLSPPTVRAVGDGPIRLGHLDHLGGQRLLVLDEGFLSNDLMTLDLQSGQLVGRVAFAGPSDLLIVDHDGDGQDDVVVLDGAAGTAQVLSTSDGVAFTNTAAFAVERGSRALALLDGAPGARRYLVGDSARASYAIYETAGGVTSRRRSWLGGANLQDLVLADFDGDGAQELVVSLSDLDVLQISAPLGSGFESFETVYTGLSPSRIRQRPSSGTTYSVLCTGSQEVRSYSLVAHELQPLDVAAVHADAIRHGWVDFDRDGQPDLVVLVARLGVQVHHNNGAGFDAPVTYPVDGELRDLLVYDAVGDSLPDLLVANSTLTGVVVFEGDGVSGFAASDTLIYSQRPARLRSHDLDNDGREDLVVLGVESQVAITFRRAAGLSNPSVLAVGEEPRDAGFGNFNGDSFADIVIANAGGASFSILNSVVKGIYSPTTVAQQTPSGAENVVVADLDQSGFDDILFSSPTSQYLTFHLNTSTSSLPNGRFSIPQRVRVGILPLDFVSADLDGDPVADLLVADAAASVITLVRSDPSILVLPASGSVRADREGSQVRLQVVGTAATAAEFQLRRASDQERLALAAVVEGTWAAFDHVAADAKETYILYDRAGRRLDEVAVGPGSSPAQGWTIERPWTVDQATVLRFRTPGDRLARVAIVDARGRRVASVPVEMEGSGWQRVRWEGSDDRGRRVARGRYWAQISVEGQRHGVPLPVLPR